MSGYHVCIIGAGPTGLMAAHTASSRGLKVLLVERGHSTPTGATFDRNVTADEPYPDPATTRASGIGGSSWRWRLLHQGGGFGARLALEPHLFERQVVGIPSWAIPFRQVLDSSREVLAALRLGFDVEELLPVGGLASQNLDVSQFGFCRSQDIRDLFARVAAHPNVTVQLGTEVVTMEMSSDRVSSALVRPTGTANAPERLVASSFLIAAATVDTCRLLAAVRHDNPSVGSLDGLGVAISDHPRLRGYATLRKDFIDLIDGSLQASPPMQLRLEPSLALLNRGLPSLNLSFVPHHTVRLKWRALRALEIAIARIDNISSTRTRSSVSSVFANLIQRFVPAFHRFGVRRGAFVYDTDRLAPKGGLTEHGEAVALVMAEQLPDSRNRFRFDFQTPNSLPTAHLELGAPFDPAPTVKVLTSVTDDMRSKGWAGEVRWETDPKAWSSHHLSGGAAISGPHAIASSDGLVNGTANLFVVGLATFPSAGHANPTLLSMALADRTVKNALFT